MTYSVKNGTATPIILNQFEGATYYIGAGDELEVESARAALTLEDFGAVLSQEDREAAINEESTRAAKGDGNQATTTQAFANVASGGGVDGVDTHIEGVEGAALGKSALVEGDPAHVDPETVVEKAPELKGADLDAALEAAGLSKSGTADEKRARFEEWAAAQH